MDLLKLVSTLLWLCPAWLVHGLVELHGFLKMDFRKIGIHGLLAFFCVVLVVFQGVLKHTVDTVLLETPVSTHFAPGTLTAWM